MCQTHRVLFLSLSLVLAVALTGCHSLTPDAKGPQAGQGGQHRGGRGGRGGGLYTNETVQKDLALTDEQKKAIKTISDDFRSSIGDLSRDERREQMPELRKAMNAKIAALLNDQQKARMKEIELQSQGTGALTTKDVAAALKLSDDQVSKIKALNKSYADCAARRLRGWRRFRHARQAGHAAHRYRRQNPRRAHARAKDDLRKDARRQDRSAPSRIRRRFRRTSQSRRGRRLTRPVATRAASLAKAPGSCAAT